MNNRYLASITIWGHPAVLKNSKQIIKVNGRRIVKSSKSAEAYQHKAIGQIVSQWGQKPPIECALNAAIVTYGAWKSEGGNTPDESNLLQMPEDLLQAAGVVEDDKLIESHNGSRRVCLCDWPCPKKDIITRGPRKGQPKDDCGAVKKCPFERVEIYLREASALESVVGDIGKLFKSRA